MINKPDSWKLIKVTNNTKSWYVVFASWSGGYMDSDCWRLNSGIVNTKETNTHYIFEGNSGSVYHCKKDTYGNLSVHNQSVYSSIIAKTKGTEAVDDISNINFVTKDIVDLLR